MRYYIEDREFEYSGALPQAAETRDGSFLVKEGSWLIEIWQRSDDKLSDGFAFDGMVISIETDRDRLIAARFEAAREAATGAGKSHQLKAPMPGLVKKILAQPGDSVLHETPVIILEAMKMENVLMAGAVGIIRDIRIKEGKNVEKNTILASIE